MSKKFTTLLQALSLDPVKFSQAEWPILPKGPASFSSPKLINTEE
jgi:hypothetical protein